MTQKESRVFEKVAANKYPKLNLWLYKGRGVSLQTLEGNTLMKAMLNLLDKNILSLPIFDALYVQEKYAKEAKVALENSWKKVLNVSIKPYTKIDKSN